MPSSGAAARKGRCQAHEVELDSHNITVTNRLWPCNDFDFDFGKEKCLVGEVGFLTGGVRLKRRVEEVQTVQFPICERRDFSAPQHGLVPFVAIPGNPSFPAPGKDTFLLARPNSKTGERPDNLNCINFFVPSVIFVRPRVWLPPPA